MILKKRTFWKENDTTKKGHEETDLREKEAVVVAELVRKYKIPKRSKVVECKEDQERRIEEQDSV